jgi:integrase
MDRVQLLTSRIRALCRIGHEQPCVRYGRVYRGEPNSEARALALRSTRELSNSSRQTRAVRSGAKHWRPSAGLSPDEGRPVLTATSCDRDHLLLRVLWATGARISEVLALRARDVRRASPVHPNWKNPNQTTKRVCLPGAELGLTGELLLWAKEQGVVDDEPLFFSRKRGRDGSRRALRRGQTWVIVKEASELADVRVLAPRASKHGQAGYAAPVHPHLFRHARVRQTKSLPVARCQTLH